MIGRRHRPLTTSRRIRPHAAGRGSDGTGGLVDGGGGGTGGDGWWQLILADRARRVRSGDRRGAACRDRAVSIPRRYGRLVELDRATGGAAARPSHSRPSPRDQRRRRRNPRARARAGPRARRASSERALAGRAAGRPRPPTRRLRRDPRPGRAASARLSDRPPPWRALARAASAPAGRVSVHTPGRRVARGAVDLRPVERGALGHRLGRFARRPV